MVVQLNGNGKGKNNSSLDDGQTQSAIRLLVHVARASEFKSYEVGRAAKIALSALLAAQFKCGAFPQVWTGPVEDQPIMKASYPTYDWQTEGRIKEYWNYYTINDGVPGYVAQTLIDAHRIYGTDLDYDNRYLSALRRLGDFLLLAQMPDPQPGWAQQYNYRMNPIWARKFEPAAIAGDESQEVIDTLMTIYQATGDRKYLAPIPQALSYLKKSLLPDGRLARYYELRTNRPLYMKRRGDVYSLTYDDSDLPGHYGWKVDARLDGLQARYDRLLRGEAASEKISDDQLEREVRRIIDELDDQGRWIDTATGQSLVGQPKFPPGTKFISSETFSKNLTTLSEYLIRCRTDQKNDE